VPGTGDTLLVLCPLGIEARAARRALPGAHVVRTGVGMQRSLRAAARLRELPASAVAVAGFCGGLDPELEPGALVVATELRADGAAVPCSGAPALAGALRAAGFDPAEGPIASVRRLARGASRARLAESGAIAVDMESAWLAGAAGQRPLAVLRVVVDTPGRELLHPLATVRGGIRAYRALRGAAPALAAWASRLAQPQLTQ